jgi:hypothetical protein
VAGKLKPGSAALRLKLVLVVPLTPLSEIGALFVRVIEPANVPPMVTWMLVNSPVAGGNWEQVIGMFVKSVNWAILLQEPVRVPAAAIPEAASKNITILTVRMIGSRTEHFALIKDPPHATASVPEAWYSLLTPRG